jgi:AhpD family alkylhydroperoxidase
LAHGKPQGPRAGDSAGLRAVFPGADEGRRSSVRQRELIALGIAVAIHCEPCIEAHVEKCLKAGATGQEIMEAAGVGVLMGGGPAYMYSALAAAALERLEQGGATGA